ncbi:EthD family reductase [Primorskyibacter sp. 2E107]|uniref:EthD family reductase n=1 Tax=Primorskyibacter sp. 2E107 TaxID=3403458 RepID=UPI003AF58A5D
MGATLQVIYPATEGSRFDMDYYTETHLPMVGTHWGPLIASTLVTRGLSGGPDVPAGFHVIASIVFKDADALKTALETGGPLIEDIANFTDCPVQMLIGEAIG